MKILELIVVISIVALSMTFFANFRGFKLKPSQPYELKAKVFSMLQRLRSSGKDYALWIYKDEFRIRVGRKRFAMKHGIDIEKISSGYILFRNGRIMKAGTVYGRGWKLSFLPVTGSMRVGE